VAADPHRDLRDRAAFADRMASIALHSAETDEAAAQEQTASGAAEDAACSRWHAERARRNQGRWLAQATALRAQLPQQRLGVEW
jgi:hypothetical protein